MFIPAGYWCVHEAVGFVARKGEAGSLPARFGFSVPGVEPDALDIGADANARHVLGELLAAGTLRAEMILLDGKRLPVPASFWSGPEAYRAMLGEAVSVAAFIPRGMPEKVLIIILKQADVLTALGIRFADEQTLANNDAGSAQASPVSGPVPVAPSSLATTKAGTAPLAQKAERKVKGLNFAASDAPLVEEMATLLREGKATGPWDAALAVSSKAKGAGGAVSKAKRLLDRFQARGGIQPRSETERD